MGKYNLDILGISKCRWTSSGKMCTQSETGEGYTNIYSGQQDTHHRGVALIKNKHAYQHTNGVGANQKEANQNMI